ncbi:MAG TPA: hypothetical protein VFA22_02445, partial [Stellaceae bacterium]|nr:hypothetical protein [Stellaceae bacterium]
MKRFVLALSLSCAGCASGAYVVDDTAGRELATCYESFAQAFCRVVTPPGTSVVGGQPLGATAAAVVTGGASVASSAVAAIAARSAV